MGRAGVGSDLQGGRSISTCGEGGGCDAMGRVAKWQRGRGFEAGIERWIAGPQSTAQRCAARAAVEAQWPDSAGGALQANKPRERSTVPHCAR